MIVLAALALTLAPALAGPVRVEQAPSPGTSEVRVELRFALGAAEDPPGRAGITHASEHLALASGPLTEALEAAGGRIVGRTTHDEVSLVVSGPLSASSLVNDVVLAALDAGEAPWPEGAWERERADLRVEVLAARYLEPALRGLALYPPGHPYHRPAAGLIDELDQLRPADVRGWLREALLPALAQVTLVGAPADPRLVERISRPAAHPPPARAAPADRPWPQRWWVDAPASAQLVAWRLPVLDEAGQKALMEIASSLNKRILKQSGRGPIAQASAGVALRRLGAELVVRAEPAARWAGQLLGRPVGPAALRRLLREARRALAASPSPAGDPDPLAPILGAWLRPDQAVTLSLGPSRSQRPKAAEELPTR